MVLCGAKILHTVLLTLGLIYVRLSSDLISGIILFVVRCVSLISVLEEVSIEF